MKKCGKCNEEKDASAFYKAARYADGLISPCIACRKKRYQDNREKALLKMREYSARYAEEARLRSRQWRINNKDKRARQANTRRARKRNVAWEKYSEDAVLRIYGTACHLCGEEIDLSAGRKPGSENWQNGLHIDHVIDLSRGGTDTLANVRPAHGLCNLRKPKTKRIAEM